MTFQMIIEKAKDLLDKDKEIKEGDFVTINNDAPVEVYVVKSITGSTAALYCIEITESKDDVYVKEVYVPTNDLLYLGESYVNVGGMLWKIRDKVLKGNTNSIVTRFCAV